MVINNPIANKKGQPLENSRGWPDLQLLWVFAFALIHHRSLVREARPLASLSKQTRQGMLQKRIRDL